jgi:hypothetical protein
MLDRLAMVPPEHPGEQQPRLRGAVGNPGMDECRERRFEVFAGG